MNNIKQIVVTLSLVAVLVTLLGCNEAHARKKQEMVQKWDQSTAAAKLPAIESMLEQGQVKKAKKELAKCLQANPELAGAYVLVGRIHFLETRNELARQSFEHAIDLDPELDRAWHFLGSLAVLDKDFSSALDCFGKSLDLMPFKTEYILSLCDVYVETGQFDKAMEIIDQSLDREPQNLDLLLSKAQILQQDQRLDQAIRIYEQAQLMHGDKRQILEPCGYVYISQQQWARAAEKFELLIEQYNETDPHYNVTMRSLAQCLLNSNQYGQALFWYDKLSVIYRDDAQIWLDMAQAALGMNDAKRASYCAVNVLKIRPAWSKAYAVLGSARYMQGLYQQSLQALYKITDDEELAAFAWFMSGRCYQQLGQNRQANTAFEKAEQLDPDNELISAFLTKTIHPL